MLRTIAPGSGAGTRRALRFATLPASLALVAGSVALGAGSAQAVAPVGPVTAVVAPSAQTNHTVYASAIANGHLFLGGDFTSVRPNGKTNSGFVSRTGFAVLSSSTGVLTPIHHSFGVTSSRAVIQAFVLSPDKKIIYVGGTFASVDGQPRHNLAAFDTVSGALVAGFGATGVDGSVLALTTIGQVVYAGGTFTHAGTAARVRIAAFRPAGTLLPYRPTITGNAKAGGDTRVLALDVSANGRILLVGGAFDAVNGGGAHAFDGLDPTTGKRLPFATHVNITNTSYITTITHDTQRVYLGSRDDENTTNARFEGTKALLASNGATVWTDYCYGDTFAVYRLKGSLFVGSHAHDCSAISGWPETAPRHYQSIYAVNPATGALQSFYPQILGAANVPGSQDSTRTFTSDGNQLVAAGGWTTVDGRASQDIARFLPTGPGTKPGIPGASVKLTNGRPVITFHTVGDDDNTALTYRVYRHNQKTPFYTKTIYSTFWNHHAVNVGDPGKKTGFALSYVVTVSDGTNVVSSPTTSQVRFIAPGPASR